MDGGNVTVHAILETTKFESGVRGVRSKLGDIGDTGEREFGRVDAAVGKTTEGFTVAKGVAANLATQGIGMAANALGGFVKDSVQVGASFEQSMSNVAALSGATGDQLQALTDKASELGATTTFTASQAADALSYMALAGWDTEQMLASVGDVLTLAQAGQMDLASASDLVTDYLSAFNMEASEAKRMSDVLAYAQANANTTVEGLGMAFKNCAANCNAAGLDVETTSAAISMMANQGLKGSEAGTALTAVMRDMTAQMEDGAIKIGDTSVAVADAEGNYRDFAEILADVGAATDGMGEADRAVALQSTFTADSVKGMNLLLNAGAGQLSSFRGELYNSAGAAEQLASTMTDNLQGDVAAMGSAFEALQKDVYEGLKEPLREAMQLVTNEVIPNVRYMLDHVDEIAPTFAGAAGGVALFAGAAKMKGVASSIGGVTGAVKLLGAATKTCLPLAVLTAVGAAVGKVAGKVAEYKELTDKTKAAANAYKDASQAMYSAIDSEATAWANAKGFSSEYKGSLEDLKAEVQDAIDGNAEMAQSINDLFSAAGNDIGKLEGYANTIDELAGRSDLTKEEVAKLEIAIQNVNEALGTSYELSQDENGVYQVIEDGATVAKDAVLALVDAQKLQIMQQVNGEAYAEAQKAYADALTAQANAQMAVNDAERDGGEASAKLKNQLHEADAAVRQAKEAMDACADSQTLFQMALDSGAGSVVRAVADHMGLQAAMQASGKSSLDLVSDLENVGASAESLAGLSNEACAELAQAYDGTFTSIAGILAENGVAMEESWATGQIALEKLGASWQDMGDISCDQLDAVMSRLVTFSEESGNSLDSVGMSATELASLSAEELAGLGATFDTSLSGLVAACSEAGVEMPTALRDSLVSGMSMNDAVAFFVEQGQALPEGFASSIAESTGEPEAEVQAMIDALVVKLESEKDGGSIEEAAAVLGHQVPEGLQRAFSEGGDFLAVSMEGLAADVAAQLEAVDFKGRAENVMSLMGDGFIAGAKAYRDKPESAARTYGEAVEEALRAQLGIHSPSKVTEEIGGYAAEGFKVGFEDGIPGVAQAMASLCSAAEAEARSGMRAAEQAFSESISRIRSMFNFTVSWPHVPMPHFNVSPGGWTMGDLVKGTTPNITLDWYANGGVFDKASLIGVGEAGPEAVVPLLGQRMRPFAEAVAEGIGAAGGTSNYTINGDVIVDASRIRSDARRQEVMDVIFDVFSTLKAGA